LKAEALSGAIVEAVHGESDVHFGNVIETHLLGEELAGQAVHVLVCATLPGGIRMSEEEVGMKLLDDSLVLRELFPIVACESVNAGCKWRKQGDHGVRDGLCGLEWDMGDQRKARGALVDGNERLFLTDADGQVDLPVTEAFAVVDNRRSQLDLVLVGDSAASLMPPIALPSCILAGARCDAACHPARLSV